MRKLFSTALVLGLLTFLALTLAGALDKTADLKKADQDWAKSVADRNVDQFMTFIGDDASMCDLSGKWMHGKDTIKADWTKALGDPSFKLSWTVDAAEVSKSGDMGFTRGSFEGSQGNDKFSGSYATVWEKGKDGKWKVAVDIASAAPPPAQK
jgi:ketosteroid isomerase-like protein